MRKTTLGTALALPLLLAAVPALAASGPGTLKFDERTIETREGAGMVVVKVERSKGEQGEISVDYATADGTAVAGGDYTAVSGTLTWGAGDESDRTFEVPILDDTDVEGSEMFQVVLSNPTGGAAIDPSRGSAAVRIQDDDGGAGDDGEDDGNDDHGHDGNDDGGNPHSGAAGKVEFDQRNFVVTESVGMATISVEREDGSAGAISVDYSTDPKTATEGSDYTAASGTLTWDDGETGRKTFQVPVLDDSAKEPTEQVYLRLENPTGGAVVDHAKGWALLSILDDDEGNKQPEENGPGTLEFDEESFQVIEGEPMATIRVERSHGHQGAVSVEFSTADETAMAGSDYTAASGVLSWDDGEEGTKTFDVPILDDTETEGNETVALALANPTGGATIDSEDGTSTLTILDDDGSTAACVPDDTTPCLSGDRFQVRVVWRTSDGGSGDGHAASLSDNSGTFWFFDASNVELLIKVLDACDLSGFNTYWVFFAATTNVDFTVTVTDTATGVTKEYSNPAGTAAEPIQDTLSFQTCS